MTEHTDKAPQKSGKKPPAKRAGRPRTPDGKQDKSPVIEPPLDTASGKAENAAAATAQPGAGKTSGLGATATPPAKASQGKTFDPNYPGPKSLAPDPATITFGSNKPIVAPPPKLPESSGLKFSGPSAGELKASGPQPTSPKASGLTFTSAKTGTSTKLGPSTKQGNGGGPAAGKEALRRPEPKAPETKKYEAKKPDAKTPEAKKPEPKKPDAKSDDKAGGDKAGGAKPADPKKATTKPAIAPPVTVRRFDKERSTGGFVMILFALTVIGGGLAVWMKVSSETPPATPAAPGQVASVPAVPEASVPAAEPAEPEPARSGRSVRAPEAPGPLAAPAGQSAAAAAGGLSPAEIGELQELLGRLDFDPGSETGVLTSQTTAAIRSYQEMAGLPADGEANAALLDELRSVVELYGG